MGHATILTAKQQELLQVIAQEKLITKNFIFSGGTVLAEYYLHHRLSEDLDFFSEQEIDSQYLLTFFKKIKKQTKITSVDYTQSFNRNLFFLHFANDVIKTEFTYFPFPSIEPGPTQGKLRTDSLLDIAVNKVFTIYQKPRSRDFIDLFCILRLKKNWSMYQLIKHAQIKFESPIDILQLGSQFLRVQELKDYPHMIIDLKENVWQQFFLTIAKQFEKKILK